jgi:hypothetical protein
MIKGILVTVTDEIKVVDVDTTSVGEESPNSLQAHVKGWIEMVRPRGLPDHFMFVCNEEGKLLNLKPNFVGTVLYGCTQDYIAGDILICKEDYGNDGVEIVDMCQEEMELLLGVLNLIAKAK